MAQGQTFDEWTAIRFDASGTERLLRDSAKRADDAMGAAMAILRDHCKGTFSADAAVTLAVAILRGAEVR